jgi:hypothetical protein
VAKALTDRKGGGGLKETAITGQENEQSASAPRSDATLDIRVLERAPQVIHPSGLAHGSERQGQGQGRLDRSFSSPPVGPGNPSPTNISDDDGAFLDDDVAYVTPRHGGEREEERGWRGEEKSGEGGGLLPPTDQDLMDLSDGDMGAVGGGGNGRVASLSPNTTTSDDGKHQSLVLKSALT